MSGDELTTQAAADKIDGADLVDFATAAEIGFKIAEMVERVRLIDPAVPGAIARWSLTVDGQRFDVAVTHRRKE